MHLDLIVATDPENEAKVYKALESLPDKAVLELEPGEITKYTVVRVGDETFTIMRPQTTEPIWKVCEV